jgi:hypothetical protein
MSILDRLRPHSKPDLERTLVAIFGAMDEAGRRAVENERARINTEIAKLYAVAYTVQEHRILDLVRGIVDKTDVPATQSPPQPPPWPQ